MNTRLSLVFLTIFNLLVVAMPLEFDVNAEEAPAVPMQRYQKYSTSFKKLEEQLKEVYSAKLKHQHVVLVNFAEVTNEQKEGNALDLLIKTIPKSNRTICTIKQPYKEMSRRDNIEEMTTECAEKLVDKLQQREEGIRDDTEVVVVLAHGLSKGKEHEVLKDNLPKLEGSEKDLLYKINLETAYCIHPSFTPRSYARFIYRNIAEKLFQGGVKSVELFPIACGFGAKEDSYMISTRKTLNLGEAVEPFTINGIAQSQKQHVRKRDSAALQGKALFLVENVSFADIVKEELATLHQMQSADKITERGMKLTFFPTSRNNNIDPEYLSTKLEEGENLESFNPTQFFSGTSSMSYASGHSLRTHSLQEYGYINPDEELYITEYNPASNSYSQQDITIDDPAFGRETKRDVKSITININEVIQKSKEEKEERRMAYKIKEKDTHKGREDKRKASLMQDKTPERL